MENLNFFFLKCIFTVLNVVAVRYYGFSNNYYINLIIRSMLPNEVCT